MLVVLVAFFRCSERRSAWQFLLCPFLATLSVLPSLFRRGARVTGQSCRFLAASSELPSVSIVELSLYA